MSKPNKRTPNERKGKDLMKSKGTSHLFSQKDNMLFSKRYFQERFSTVNCVLLSNPNQNLSKSLKQSNGPWSAPLSHLIKPAQYFSSHWSLTRTAMWPSELLKLWILLWLKWYERQLFVESHIYWNTIKCIGHFANVTYSQRGVLENNRGLLLSWGKSQ